jgi:hypothetical protein
MNTFPSSSYMVEEVSRQRHADLLREAEEWRLMKEASQAQPRRRFPLVSRFAALRNLLPQRKPQRQSASDMVPC